MKITKHLTALAAACSLLCMATPAGAVIINVAGNANPWNALASTGDGLNPPSVAVNAGQTVSVAASGTVNTGGSNPDAGPDGSAPVVSHAAQNGVGALTANQGALVGVWSTGAIFVIGTGGTWTAPAGATALYFGVMDSDTFVPSWNNNTGSFNADVNITGAGVPDYGSTLVLMLIGAGLLFVYRKQVLA
jgi:hypothetical protein